MDRERRRGRIVPERTRLLPGVVHTGGTKDRGRRAGNGDLDAYGYIRERRAPDIK